MATDVAERTEQSTELITQDGHGTIQGRLTPAQAIEELDTLRQFVSSRLVEDEDFGVIPGTNNRRVLLKPGAQKILMYYNVYPSPKVNKTEIGEGHVEYEVTAELFSRSTGQLVGVGVGNCSTMEGRYRFRNAALTCPACGQAAIIKGKEEYGGGWVCFKKKDGCGAKYNLNDPAIANQPRGQVENENIWDQRNTVLKMAKKRAIVDAAIELSCIGDLFTQDMEDAVPEPPAARPVEQEPKRAAQPDSSASTNPVDAELNLLILQEARATDVEKADVVTWLKGKYGLKPDQRITESASPELKAEMIAALKERAAGVFA